jgi:hypothetical protein
MTKLVSEMPSEPVGFLIHSLQVKAEKMVGAQCLLSYQLNRYYSE